jgi:hypothetical protein
LTVREASAIATEAIEMIVAALVLASLLLAVTSVRGETIRTVSELICVECGATTEDGRGWKAEVAPDLLERRDADEIAVYCPECWQAEFGERSTGAHPDDYWVYVHEALIQRVEIKFRRTGKPSPGFGHTIEPADPQVSE